MIGLIIIIGRMKGCFDLQCRSSPIPRGGGTKMAVSQPQAVHDHRVTTKEMIGERGRQIVGASAIWRRYVSLITLERRYGEGWKASSGLVGEVVQNFLPRKQKCPPAHCVTRYLNKPPGLRR